jgi:hypothetical protein
MRARCTIARTEWMAAWSRRWPLLQCCWRALPIPAHGPLGPGDARLRTDVELLRAHGYILGPVNAWPLPWAQINRGLERAQGAGPLPPHIAAAVQRITALSEYNGKKSRYMVRAAATNDASLVRGFERVARNPGEVTVSASHDLGALHITWGGTWQSDGTDRQRATQFRNGFSPDPSFAVLKLGSNWVLYGGWIDTWWGAGHDGSMIFSTSARPIPKVGFRRLEPFTIDAPVLRWLGPVSSTCSPGWRTKSGTSTTLPLSGCAFVPAHALFRDRPEPRAACCAAAAGRATGRRSARR